MSLVRIRRILRRPRTRIAIILSLLALASVVAAHHEMPMDMHGMAAAAVCLAVLGAGIAVAVALGRAVKLPRPGRVADLAGLVPMRARPAERSRAGPAVYLRLSVLRR